VLDVGDRRPAQQARLAGTPVGVAPGSEDVGTGVVLGAQRLDPAPAVPVAEQVDEVGPQRVPLLASQRPPRQLGVEPVTEEQLGAVHVAHAGDH
jgi:hypothetical protein